jgi:ribonuclease P protein component
MQRLHQESDIATMFAQVKPQYLDKFQIYCNPNNLSDHRLGLIIAKKNIPLAVKRNRLKRQIRELCRRSLITKNNKYDILVLVRTKITDQNKADFLHQLHNYINNLN